MTLRKLLKSVLPKSKSPQRTISNKRRDDRVKSISQWSIIAQNCDKKIANIDEKLSNLSGPFTRKNQEQLEAKRAIAVGERNTALAHLKKHKSSLSSIIKHNQDLTDRRLKK